MKFKTNCCYCGKEIVRKEKSKTGKYFCNIECKKQWQLLQKPLTKEELVDLYIFKRKSANEIALMVGRNSKRVWEWLKEYKIETRPRGTDYGQCFKKGQESIFKGHHHTKEVREKIRKLRLQDGHVPYLINGVHWLKATGRKPASYRGGISPLRPKVYSTREWKECVKTVWKRDDAKCQLCGLDHRKIERNKIKFHIHHLYGFTEYPRLRTNPDNLVLLCENCHRYVHSKKNIEKKYLLKDMILPKWLIKSSQKQISLFD